MSGLFSTLNIGVGALAAFQASLQTSSHNIANANTPGYSRQRALLTEAQYPDVVGDFGNVRLGRGVTVSTIERMRDLFLDGQFQREQATHEQTDQLQKTYGMLQTSLHEPSERGLSAGIDRFFNALEQLTVNPRDAAARTAVQTAGSSLATQFNQLHQGFVNQIAQMNTQVASEVTAVNGLSQEIDTLNRQIATLSVQGTIPNELLDAREIAIEKITALTGATVASQTDGSVAILVDGYPLVDAAGPHPLAAVLRTGDPLGRVDVVDQATGTVLTFPDGTLKALIDSRDTIIPGYDTQIDTLAQTLITQVNAVHRQGQGLDGSVSLTGSVAFTGALAANAVLGLNGTNINLAAGDDLSAIVAKINLQSGTTGVQATISNTHLVLSPVNPGQTVQITNDPDAVSVSLGLRNDFFSGTSAATMSLSAAVAANTNAIAASLSGSPGDSANALALSALRSSLLMSGGTQTIAHYYQSMISQLGAEASAADVLETNQRAVLDQITVLQQSASGVSLDEEMVDMTRHQRAYEAASKVIATADKMLEVLMALR